MSLVSLYDEASLWMTPSGAKDGRLFSELPVPVYGPELVRNGGFDSGTGWSTPSGWSISNGTLQGTNVAAVSATQAGITFLNKSFRVEYTITEISQGDVRIYLGGTQSTPNRNAVGTYVEYIDITTANTTLYIQGINNFTGKIDNISVKEVSNIGDFTFSRGSNLAATRVGPTGLIEKGRENLLPYSNAFTSGDWQDTGASYFTSGQSGYDGTNDAWRFTTVNQGERFQIVSSVVTGKTGVHTLSAYFKKGTADGVRMRVDMSGTDANIYVNLLDGNIFNSVGDIAAKLTDIGGGWYRAELTANWVNVLNIRIYPTNTTGNDAVGTIYIQSAQLEIGLAATDYIESGATTGKAGLLEDEPRLDYSGGATCPSLLLEPSRTQLIGQTEYYNTYWSLARATINDNDTTSPEGKDNASALVENNTLGSHPLYKENISVNSSASYTLSVFIKKGSRDYFRINPTNGGSSVYFNINTGVVHSGTGKIESYGNDWFRCSTTWTTTGTNQAVYIEPSLDGSSASYLGNGSIATYIYGIQLEEGSYPTSYIPNHSGTGSVTRSRDQADNSSLNPILGNGNISVMYDFIYDVVGREGSGQIFLLYSGNNSLGIKGTQPTDRRLQLFSYGDFSGTIGFNEDVPYQTRHKVVFRVTGEVVELFYNGVKQNNTIDASALGGVYNWSRIKLDPTNAILAGLNQLAVFPTALTDAECIKLTTL